MVKKVFQKNINNLESDLLDTGQFIFGPPPRPPFFPVRSVEDKLGGQNDSRDSSARSRSWQLGSTSLEKDTRRSSMPQISVVSSVVVVERDNESESTGEILEGPSKAR